MIDRGTTEKQLRILDVIREFTAEMGYPPSVREIGERVGLSSSSTVQSHLKTLERRGYVVRLRGAATWCGHVGWRIRVRPQSHPPLARVDYRFNGAMSA